MYTFSSQVRKAPLLKRLILQKLQEGEDVRIHLMKFFDTVDKLASIDISINDDLLVILLLYSLPGSYEGFRCAMECRDELPKPELLKVKILEESESKQKNNDELSAEAVLVSQYKKNFKKSESKDKSNEQRGKFKSYECKKVGYQASECLEKMVKLENQESSTKSMMHLHVQSADQSEKYDSEWYLDSGCTDHYCNDKFKFSTLKNFNESIYLADSKISAQARGTVCLVILNAEVEKQFDFQNVLYVPGLRVNLMSVSRITDEGNIVTFSKDMATVSGQNGDVKFIAERHGDLYRVKGEAVHCCLAKIDGYENLLLWHCRLGHLNFADVYRLINKRLVGGKMSFLDSSLPCCEICLKGKISALPFKSENPVSTKKLEIVHMDICGAFRVESNDGAKYFVSFIDDNTHWTVVNFFKNKSDLLKVFKMYKQTMENQSGCKIKYLQSNNGHKLFNLKFDNYLSSQGIKKRLTVPHNPEQNKVVQRKNRILVETAQCLLIQSGISESFWAEAISTANYIRNRCPISSIDLNIPFEKWTGNKVSIEHLKVFGSKVVVLDEVPGKCKPSPKGLCGVFLGYVENSTAFRIWINEKKSIVPARSVKFLTEFDNTEEIVNGSQDELKCYDLLVEPGITAIAPNKSNRSPIGKIVKQDLEFEFEEQLSTSMRKGSGLPKLVLTGGSGKQRKIYSMVPVQKIDLNQEDENTDNREDKNKDNQEDYETEDVFYDAEETVQNFNMADESLHRALNGNFKGWKDAIYTEIKNLVGNEIFDIVDKPSGKNISGYRTILVDTLGQDTELIKRKVRIVAHGFTQKAEIDFNDTFAAVVEPGSIRLVMALAARFSMKVYQFDLEAAYLNVDFEEKIYMRTPIYLKEMLYRLASDESQDYFKRTEAKRMIKRLEKPNQVCKLRKAIYELRQAGRKWNEMLHQVLSEMGLKATSANPLIYFAYVNSILLIVSVNMNNMLVICRDNKVVQKIKIELTKNFKVKDLGLAKYYLGIEIDQHTKGISLSQRTYIKEILKKYSMEQTYPEKTPMEFGIDLNANTGDQDNYSYRELIRDLSHLSIGTRPDIMHAVSVLSEYNDCYDGTHWKAAKRVLRYLTGTLDVRLNYSKDNARIKGYVDASWGNYKLDLRSYTGYVFMLNGAPVTWESQKQQTIVFSSTEAEYMALSAGVKELLYLKTFMTELKLNDLSKIILYNNKHSAELLVKDSVYHSRSKHIDLLYHFVRKNLHKNEFILKHASTNMLADFMTKSLLNDKHIECMKELGMMC